MPPFEELKVSILGAGVGGLTPRLVREANLFGKIVLALGPIPSVLRNAMSRASGPWKRMTRTLSRQNFSELGSYLN